MREDDGWAFMAKSANLLGILSVAQKVADEMFGDICFEIWGPDSFSGFLMVWGE